MKLKLTLYPFESRYELPINLNSHLTGVIMKVMQSVGDQVFQDAKSPIQFSWKEFDHYTFSQLHIPSRQIRGDFISCVAGDVSLYISSPSEAFIMGLMQIFADVNDVKIANTFFKVTQIEIIPQPKIESTAFFTCLSPVVIYRKGENIFHRFAVPQDFRLSAYAAESVKINYERYYGVTPDSDNLEIKFEADYVLKRKGKITKLIQVNIDSEKAPAKIKGFLAPFYLSGDPKLMKFAYERGLGEYSNFGFGMLDWVQNFS